MRVSSQDHLHVSGNIVSWLLLPEQDIACFARSQPFADKQRRRQRIIEDPLSFIAKLPDQRNRQFRPAAEQLRHPIPIDQNISGHIVLDDPFSSFFIHPRAGEPLAFLIEDRSCIEKTMEIIVIGEPHGSVLIQPVRIADNPAMRGLCIEDPGSQVIAVIDPCRHAVRTDLPVIRQLDLIEIPARARQPARMT